MAFMQKAVDKPFGFRPHGAILRVGQYYKDASAAAIYPGDAVIMETDGGIAVAAASSVPIIGVAASYSAASTEVVNFPVYDHPDQQFVVQDDSAGTGMTRASEGSRCDITVTTGDTTTFQSLHELDSSTINATETTLAVQVIRLHPIEESSYATTTSEWRKWIVVFAEHLYQGANQAGI